MAGAGLLGPVRGDALGEERLLRLTRSRGAASSQADALAPSPFSGCAGACMPASRVNPLCSHCPGGLLSMMPVDWASMQQVVWAPGRCRGHFQCHAEV